MENNLLPQYEQMFESILKKQDEQAKLIVAIHKCLFVDNGGKSYQSFRRFTEVFIKAHLWIYGLIIAGGLTTCIGLAVGMIWKKLMA